MTKIRTLSGLGKLWDGNRDLGPVVYEIQVFADGELKRGEGSLQWTGEGPWDKFEPGKPLMLMLKTGEQVNLAIKGRRSEGADILTTGPIPDPVDWLAED